MKSSLLRYKIGLGVIGLFLVGVLVFVLVQANVAKQDLQTTKRANEIADKLNSYVNDNDVAPESLADANISNLPDAISYRKLSDTSYEFCITYRAANNGAPLQTVVDDATTNFDPYTGAGGSTPSSNATSLYISGVHAKGRNCQTIDVDAITPLNQYDTDPGASSSSNSVNSQAL